MSTKPTEKQISKELGCCDSAIEKNRNDISIDSPYCRNKEKKNTQGHFLDQSSVKGSGVEIAVIHLGRANNNKE